MFIKILSWISNISRYIDYLKGHAQKCDYCHEIVYGWFGTNDSKRKCTKCTEANGPTIFSAFVKQHIKDLSEGK